ncbi:hypothetical protein OPIT5_26070 [Opitutaceae bacterium TAV5]|nr:hypothetical protein OPIT5_26070 [Opitutaceae bacterium TAV5]
MAAETGSRAGRPSPVAGDRQDRQEKPAPRRGAEAPPGGGDRRRREWRQVAWITAGAIALYFVARWLPTGTNLSHADFAAGSRPGEGGVSALDLCDPANPQFLPVMAVRSPVSTTLRSDGPAVAGKESRFVLSLTTASGKPIGPDDLFLVHTQKLHLMIVDPTLEDYRHLHPEPGEREGEWVFRMTPQRGGDYRLFADFMPVATGRGLYAMAEFAAASGAADAGAEGEAGGESASLFRSGRLAEKARGTGATVVVRDGYRFELSASAQPVRAGQQAELAFAVTREGGGAVPLEPVMDAYAHLVAFDEARSGFAHLHPQEADLSKKPDAEHPRLTFAVTIPQAGRYVVWAQVDLAGAETFVPFPLEVAP